VTEDSRPRDDLQDERDRIVLATLPHVAFEGWTDRALRRGAADAGLSPEQASLAFPGGTAEVIRHWSDWADRRMLESLQSADLGAMRMRERIAAAVRSRIEANAPYREPVRRTLSFLALPTNQPLAARCTYATVDAMWYACGDTATDVSFYTNRATLAGVYAATVLYWLGDSSEDFGATWAFLDRRIDDVMRIPRLTEGLKRMINPLAGPLSVLRR
jgi:ubiquinone biosynthesis protein COQ9